MAWSNCWKTGSVQDNNFKLRFSSLVLTPYFFFCGLQSLVYTSLEKVENQKGILLLSFFGICHIDNFESCLQRLCWEISQALPSPINKFSFDKWAFSDRKRYLQVFPASLNYQNEANTQDLSLHLLAYFTSLMAASPQLWRKQLFI